MRRSLRTRVAVAAGAAAGWLSRVTGRGAGATVSGRVLNAIAPGALAELAAGRHTALVSATNGKTTTTRFLAAALATNGRAVTTNSTGANLTSGIAPTLARDRHADTAVLEVDERVLPKVVDVLGTELLVLGNLSRDQLDRYGEVHLVADAWRAVTEARPHLAVVANASDPHVVWAASPAAVTWVALGLGWRQDAATCPRCGALLAWDAERFECPACGFAQPDPDFVLDGDTLVRDGDRVPLHLAIPGRWNLANAALAVAAATAHFDVAPAAAAGALGDVTTVAGRYMRIPLGDGRDARVLLAKNPAGWVEVLAYLAGIDTAVVLAVNARVADGKDPSWLWDVPYELLAGHATAASGERCLDVAVRLLYAGVECIVDPDPLTAARALPGETVHLVCSYTQFSRLYRTFGRRS